MKTLFAPLLLSSLALAASAETSGAVSTTFKLLSPKNSVKAVAVPTDQPIPVK